MVGRDSILQHVTVEEYQRVERLILRRGGQPASADEVVEKGFDVRRTELLGCYPLPVRGRAEPEEAANPLAIDVGGPP